MTAPLFGAAVHPIEGFSVIERPDVLRYDELRVDPAARVVEVGEVVHLLWSMDVETWKKTMRKEAAQRLADYAARVGVAYPLDVG